MLAVFDSSISSFLVPPVVLVLNALAVDPGQNWKGPWRWYEESMLNCCVDMEEIKQSGITLQDFQCLAFCQGLSVELQYCDDETSSLEGFRKAVERACLEEPFENNEKEKENQNDDGQKILECLVVSYSRKVLNQTGDGHFSPLAAYDKESDSVLILDTARFKYGAHWTKLPLIYEAMKPIDNATGKSRGYALLSFVSKEAPSSKETAISTPTTASESVGEDATSEKSSGTTTLINTSKLSTQPASILYRSMMNQKQKRKRYKEYIKTLREANDRYANGKDISYEIVRSYWCEGGDRPSAVWEIIVPTRVRMEEEIEMLRKMRFLMVDLHHATIERGNDTSNKIPTKRSRMGDDCETYGNHNKDTPIPTSGSSNSKNSWCRTCETYNPTTNHTLSMSAEETLYIIYLATLSEERRHDFVMNFDSPETTDVVRKQIIKEADMIASAIEVSDQLTSL
jgi:glutathione gamma-glutamylcysteinyltransferase